MCQATFTYANSSHPPRSPGRINMVPIFAGEESETQRELACLESYSQDMAEVELKS